MTSFDKIMKEEYRKLLLKDLSARLIYGVKFMIDEKYLTEDMIKGGYDKIQELYGITREGNVELLNMDYHMPVESIKPYLLPLSSMTKEQKEELRGLEWAFDNSTICNILECFGKYRAYVDHSCCSELIDWCIKNHFDYLGLIPIGLANDATGLNIY